MNSVTNHHFTNWAKNQSCVAARWIQPETEEEMIEAVKSAGKIRVVGSGHSWSSVCLSHEALLNLDRYNRILEVDKTKMEVRVQSGIKLYQLNLLLDKEGLALKNLGSISRQSVAGAISTGTHGSGIQYRILGSQVVQLSLIDAQGRKHTLHKERDQDAFNTALVNLGALGVISEYTLCVVPAFQIHERVEVMGFDEALEKLDNLLQITDHLKMWWFPHTDKMIVYYHQRTSAPANDSRLRQWIMDELISVYAYRLFLKIGTLNREWRININRALLSNFIKPINRIEKSYKVFNVPEPPLHREAEWCFDVAYAKDVLRDYKRMIDSGEHRINFLQEIRFTMADDYALSPSYGRNSVWVGCYNADNFGWQELMKEFELIGTKYKGRPHWGKESNLGADYLKGLYPGWERFVNLMKQMDPDGKFKNNFITKFFG